MTELLSRLRGPAPSIPAMRDAADEIERLGRTYLSHQKSRDEEMMFLVERVHNLVNALEAVAMMRSLDECPLAAEMRKIALDAITPTE